MSQNGIVRLLYLLISRILVDLNQILKPKYT